MASIVSAGTTSATALNMSADTTGVLQLASNNGTVALTIDTSQNIGVNSASSTVRTKLMVASSNASDTLTVGTVSGGFSITNSNTSYGLQFGSLSTGNSWIQSARMDGTATAYNLLLQLGGGNVGIGITSPSRKLVVTSPAATKLGGVQGALFTDSANDGGLLIGSDYTYGNIQGCNAAGTSAKDIAIQPEGGNTVISGTSTNYNFQLGATSTGFPFASPRFYINNSGYNGIGLVNLGNGFICFVTQPSANHQYFAGYYLNSSQSVVGSISVGTSSVAYNTTSDYRLKENIAPMTGALEKVAALKPVTYTWKESGEATQGFIAHELQAIVPECVTGEKDAVDDEGRPKYQGVDTSFLVATLTAAIQELNAKVTALENK
jgi:hypothetical protein